MSTLSITMPYEMKEKAQENRTPIGEKNNTLLPEECIILHNIHISVNLFDVFSDSMKTLDI